MIEPRFQSNLSPERLEKLVTSATIANKNQVQGLRKAIDEVLWCSIKQKRNSSSSKQVGILAGVAVVAAIQKLRGDYSSGSFGDDVRRFIVPERNELENLESRLCLASKKIQSMNYKELVDIFLIHRNHGLEYTVDYILSENIPIEIKPSGVQCF